jgi:hypothetical protein
VRTLRKGHYLRGGLLLLVLGCGACTGAQSKTLPIQSANYPTEVDLQYGRPEAASRYRQPRQVHRYEFDKTEVDLAVPVSRPKPN